VSTAAKTRSCMQVFSKTVIGPIFFRGHHEEGPTDGSVSENFKGFLFCSSPIEEDQIGAGSSRSRAFRETVQPSGVMPAPVAGIHAVLAWLFT